MIRTPVMQLVYLSELSYVKLYFWRKKALFRFMTTINKLVQNKPPLTECMELMVNLSMNFYFFEDEQSFHVF